MILTSITPEQNLTTLLTESVYVGSQGNPVKVYRQGDVPTSNKEEDFIIVSQNGNPRTYTDGIDVISGYAIVSYYTKLKSDGTIRYSRIDKVLDQIESICERASDEKYFYELDRRELVTTPTANQNIGYSYMRVNVYWHTK